MVRISKEYDVRLQEFLDTAQQLFFENGYEQTTVNHIIQKMGVAKGTFYHYFKTKADLLDKLVLCFSEKMVAAAKEITARTDLNAIEKLNAVFAANRNLKAENLDLMKLLLKALYNEDNLRLRHKVVRCKFQLTIPEFVKIIKQGKEENFFEVGDPEETAELIYLLGANFNEIIGELMVNYSQNPDTAEIINRKLKAYEAAIGKILGAPAGSLTIADRDFLKLFQTNGKTTQANGSDGDGAKSKQ